MKIYKDDIVEIITGKFKNASDISDPNDKYKYQNEPIPFVGQRFAVKYISTDNKILWGHKDTTPGHGNYFTMGVSPNDVIIFKRPLKNWIKRIFKMA